MFAPPAHPSGVSAVGPLPARARQRLGCITAPHVTNPCPRPDHHGSPRPICSCPVPRWPHPRGVAPARVTFARARRPVPPWPHPGRRAPNAATSCGAPPDAPERPSHCWLLLISPADQPLADLLPRRNTVLVTLTIFREGQIPCRLVATPRRAPTMQAVGLQCGGSAPASGTVIAWPSVQGDAVRGWVPAAPRPRRGR